MRVTLPALELDLGIGIVPALLKYLARIGPFPNDFQQVIVRVKKVHALLALMIDGAMRSIHGDGHRPIASIEITRTVAPARSAHVISRSELHRVLNSPKNICPAIRSRYVAVIAAVSTASPPTTGYARNAPTKMCTSAAKPDRPGRPSEAIAAIMKKIAHSGICFAMPEKFGISRLCDWSYIPPMRRKKRAVMMPCANICMTDPVIVASIANGMSTTVAQQIVDYTDNSMLTPFKGQVVPRYGLTMPWVNRLDLHVAQEIPIYKPAYFEVFADFVAGANIRFNSARLPGAASLSSAPPKRSPVRA